MLFSSEQMGNVASELHHIGNQLEGSGAEEKEFLAAVLHEKYAVGVVSRQHCVGTLPYLMIDVVDSRIH